MQNMGLHEVLKKKIWRDSMSSKKHRKEEAKYRVSVKIVINSKINTCVTYSPLDVTGFWNSRSIYLLPYNILA